MEKIIDNWKGYERHIFEVDGRVSFLVIPKTPEKSRRFIWRTEFFGAFDSVDLAMLEKGWHLAYHKVSDMYGCPKSIEYLRAFGEFAVKAYALNPKAVLFGFSRGGLYAVNYAAAYPENVSALYLDAPVLDIRSWPGGLNSGLGDASCFKSCLAQYGLTEESIGGFRLQPCEYPEKLAEFGIPIVGVAGLADEVVPYDENLLPFSKRFRESGGNILIIEKSDCGHHPHSIEDPTQIAQFLSSVTN